MATRIPPALSRTGSEIPPRVTFEPAAGPKQTFTIRRPAADLTIREEDEEEAAK
ncbi:MAG: hypothetical protein QOF94_1451 [Acidobacteriaceae bacterium]|jgi:hypothetical protein